LSQHGRPGPTVQEVERAYGRYAPVYDWLFGAVLEPGRRELARSAGSIASGRPIELLEVGVGTGLMLPLYDPAIRVTGVDVSAAMLAKARERVQGLHGRFVRLDLMDGERLKFADGAFDCVVLPYVLSVTPEPDRLVSEVRRVCRRDGSILILNHFSGSHFWWLLERMVRPLADRIGFRSDFDYARHILRHDWRVEAMTPVNLMGLSRLVVLRNA